MNDCHVFNRVCAEEITLNASRVLCEVPDWDLNVACPFLLRQTHRGRRNRGGRHHAHQAGGGSVPAGRFVCGDSAAGDLKMYEGIY